MFFCNCLNIVGELINGQKKEEKSKSKINHVQFCTTNSLYYELLDFFKLALGFTCDEAKITVQHPIFVNKIKTDKWTVSKCLNCDSNVYAVSENGSNEILVNGNMLRDKNAMSEMMKSENYSMPFKIILKQIDLLPNTIKSTINDDVHVKNLFTKLQDFISHDAGETEAEIRKLQNRMNQRRQQAEKEFQLVATLVNSIESSSRDNFSTLESTNDHIQSLYSTPPVTPESAQLMTIDQLPSHPITKHVDHNHREGISKHSSAIQMQQKVTRTIDFEDDIFELDGMQKSETIDENDRYHKYSDTEGSDVEEMISEKRPYARGRSGSLAIARSAPISMPQFLHHANPHLEDKKNINNDHDIASSIKQLAKLAKSVHADSIFGELPNSRPIFKYNTDF